MYKLFRWWFLTLLNKLKKTKEITKAFINNYININFYVDFFLEGK